MPEYLVPGVYVEEVNTGPRPIEGVSTSTAAIVGPTERGPMAPRLIGSWLEYQRIYGGYDGVSFTPYAVKGFFDNGGQRMFVARVVPTAVRNVFVNSPGVGALDMYTVGPGDWGERVFYTLLQGSQTNRPDYFRMVLMYFSAANLPTVTPPLNPLDPRSALDPNFRRPDLIEDFDNLTLTPGAANNVMTVVNAASNLVRINVTNPAQPFNGLPTVPAQAVFSPLGTGTTGTGAFGAADFFGDAARTPLVAAAPWDTLFGGLWGLEALAAIDEVNLILAPDAVNPLVGLNDVAAIQGAIIDQCELLRDRFAVLSQPANRVDPQQVLNDPNNRDTSYAAMYYPWIRIYDPLSRGPITVPPSGHVTGIIARTDIERGVFKAPANEVVRGALGLEFAVTDAMQAILNPRGFNCIRDFTAAGRGIRLWGARTLSSDPIWKYINVRRLFLFVEESIDQGTQWVVFEPNDEPLWAAVRRTIVSFLVGVWRSGALMGTTQDEAFFVKCDRTTMTADDIDNGRLICLIGIAPVKPAEFVIFRISQKTLDLQPA